MIKGGIADHEPSRYTVDNRVDYHVAALDAAAFVLDGL